MRVYVASKFENVVEVRDAMKRLQDLGHEITHDWTNENPGDLKDIELEEFMAGCAIKDMYGVETADALLAINHPLGKGMFVEMGMAIAAGTPVFIAFPERVNNIFSHLVGVESYPDIASAVAALDEYGQLVGE